MKTTLTFVRDGHEIFYKGNIIVMQDGKRYKVTEVMDCNTLTIRRTYMENVHKFIKYVVILGMVAMGAAAVYYSGLYDAVLAMF